MQIFIDMLKHRSADALPYTSLVDHTYLDSHISSEANQGATANCEGLLAACAQSAISLMQVAVRYDLPLEQMVAEMLTAQGANKPCKSAAEILQLYRSGKLQNAKNPATSLELAIVAMRKSKDD